MTRIFGLSVYMVKAQIECKKYLPILFLSSNFTGIIAAPKCAGQESESFHSPEIASVIIYPLSLLWKQLFFLSIRPVILLPLSFYSIECIAALIIGLTFL